jgi:hypothetical protein
MVAKARWKTSKMNMIHYESLSFTTHLYIVWSTNTTFLYCTQPLINHIDYLNWHKKHDHVVWNPSMNLSFCLGNLNHDLKHLLVPFHYHIVCVNKTYLFNCLHPPSSLPTSSFLFLNELCYYWHFIKLFLISYPIYNYKHGVCVCVWWMSFFISVCLEGRTQRKDGWVLPSSHPFFLSRRKDKE